MKRLLKVLGWTVGILVGLPLIGYLIWLTGNLSDEELDPEIARVLAIRPQQIDSRVNAYFDFIGLNAPESWNPHTWGITWLEQAKVIDQSTADPTEGNVLSPAVAAELRKATVKYDAIPCREMENCLEQVAANPSVAKQALDQEAILLRRYDAILDMKYQEPFRELHVSSPVTPSNLYVMQLAATRFALDVAKGRHAVALKRWERETAFIVRQIEGSTTILGKVMASGSLHRYHMLLAQYMSRNPDAVRSEHNTIARLLAPLPDEASSFRPAMNNEIAFMARVGLDIKRIRNPGYLFNACDSDSTMVPNLLARVLGNRFAQPKATANALVASQNEAYRIYALEGDAYRQAIRDWVSKRKTRQTGTCERLRVIFSYHNPVGKALAAVAEPNLPYLLFRRDNNLVADRQLLAFSLDMIARNISDPTAITEAIKARQASLAHPFTGEPPVWNTEKRQLGYRVPQGIDIGSFTRITVSL